MSRVFLIGISLCISIACSNNHSHRNEAINSDNPLTSNNSSRNPIIVSIEEKRGFNGEFNKGEELAAIQLSKTSVLRYNEKEFDKLSYDYNSGLNSIYSISGNHLNNIEVNYTIDLNSMSLGLQKELYLEISNLIKTSTDATIDLKTNFIMFNELVRNNKPTNISLSECSICSKHYFIYLWFDKYTNTNMLKQKFNQLEEVTSADYGNALVNIYRLNGIRASFNNNILYYVFHRTTQINTPISNNTISVSQKYEDYYYRVYQNTAEEWLKINVCSNIYFKNTESQF
jgi:hypothetical protein